MKMRTKNDPSSHFVGRKQSLIFISVLASIALAANGGAPSIDYQPKDQTAVLYQQAAFGIIASGTAPLSYQWRKNGVAIASATNDQIVIGHARFSETGAYSVVVSNAEGTVTSSNVLLTVKTPRAGDMDASFAPGSSINGPVWSVAVQPDGKALIAGNFSTVKGAVRGRIARLNADGSTDFTFMDGLSGVGGRDVAALVLQNDGKILVGGYFSSVNGVGRGGIARLNRDGSLDSTFLNGLAGVEGTDYWGYSVASIGLQKDGKFVIGGGFTNVNGVSRQGIARLNADGSLDTSFLNGLPGIGSNGDNRRFVRSIVVQDDGKLMIGGVFASVNGVARNNIARLNADGSLDTTFLNGLSGIEGGYNTVNSIAVQNDGKIVIGGSFITVNGVRREGLARLNVDGTLDSTFEYGFSPQCSGWLNSVALQRDGKLIVGGRFCTGDGAEKNIARLNTDGRLDRSFQPAQTWGSFGDPDPYCIAVLSDGRVLVGGGFATLNGLSRDNIGRLNADGTLDTDFQNGTLAIDRFDSIYSVAVQNDAKLLLAGGSDTDKYGLRSIYRRNPDGTLDQGFQGVVAALGAPIFCVAVQPDGKAIIAGGLTLYAGNLGRSDGSAFVSRIETDGTPDIGFATRIGGISQSSVKALALLADGKVLVGGRFSTVNDMPRRNIARLNPDGSTDEAFLAGLSGAAGGHFNNAPVAAIALQSDGKVLIGGSFTNVNGIIRNRIARLNPDGTLDGRFLSGLSGVEHDDYSNCSVKSIAVQGDGKVLIGGYFTTVNGMARTNLARLNIDGSLDAVFQSALSSPSVYSILGQSDGKIVVAGAGTIARLNVDGSLDLAFKNVVLNGFGFTDLRSVAMQRDGKLLVAGDFYSVNGIPAAGIARLWGSADIPPGIQNLNRSAAAAHLTWDALPNRSYRVQYNDNLTASEWTDFAGDVSGSASGTASKTDTTAGAARHRFYRVVLLP